MRKASKPWLLVIDGSGYAEVWSFDGDGLRRMLFCGHPEDAALVANASLPDTSASLTYIGERMLVRPITYTLMGGMWKLHCYDARSSFVLFLDVEKIHEWKGV